MDCAYALGSGRTSSAGPTETNAQSGHGSGKKSNPASDGPTGVPGPAAP